MVFGNEAKKTAQDCFTVKSEDCKKTNSWPQLTAKRTVVIGAGMSGKWATELALAEGAAEVIIADQKSPDNLGELLDHFSGRKVSFYLGDSAKTAPLSADLIILSPGVPWTFPNLKAAIKKGVPVTGEMELAAARLTVPLVAITGSNGKTTTTGLLGHICRTLNFPVFVGGNIGTPLSRFILSGQKAKAAIVEASSYQLETADNFHAQASAILNVTPDHLDRYQDMAEYFRAKTLVLKNQTSADLAVLNEDDILLAHKKTTARRFGFSRHKLLEFGAWIKNDEIFVGLNGRPIAGRNWHEFQLTGLHNQENVMAAVGLAIGLGFDPQQALDVALSFQPERHRLELVGEYRQVKYYDDSKGTNVGAVASALENFKEPVVLIAGGQGKGQNFRTLYKPVSKKVRQLILIGEDRNKIKKALNGAAPISLAEDMAEAVGQARRAAKRGGVVLLSPACASFDMFRDYAHRGQMFADEVRRQNK
ncbi:MAG: UDP-N-acetylmuramoyl-L-alanine--D-glutamate ligase [Candidatus Adiutrix sp.]